MPEQKQKNSPRGPSFLGIVSKVMEMKEENTQTETERLREQVKILEKLSSLGMLSAGIAHEIQNPLNFVINFSKMSHRLLDELREKPGEEEAEEIMGELSENLQKIQEHGERAISIIRGILLYSRGKEDEFVDTDVARLVKEYVWLAYHAMRANNKDFNIAIREEYEAVGMMKLIPQDFSRVVLNLMNNACYAVWERMKRLEEGYRPEILVQVKLQGNFFVLVIADNGTGIPPEVKARLFTAFFTTKPIGEGTGLGLSIVRSIVEQKHKGRVCVESEVGKGTRMIIEIPEF